MGTAGLCVGPQPALQGGVVGLALLATSYDGVGAHGRLRARELGARLPCRPFEIVATLDDGGVGGIGASVGLAVLAGDQASLLRRAAQRVDRGVAHRTNVRRYG